MEHSIKNAKLEIGLTPALLINACCDAFKKLNPRVQLRNPVMFVVYVGSLLTTILGYMSFVDGDRSFCAFIIWVAVWLWFTVLFANFAEAVAEGRSKAQASSLRQTKQEGIVKVLDRPDLNASFRKCPAQSLKKGDLILVQAGELIPLEGDVVKGVASVDESAITGESAPVIRESGGDFSSVTGGTRVLSDWLIIRLSVNPGEGFIDRMIAMVESATRQKSPNEIALNILLAALTIVFLVVTATLLPYSAFAVKVSQTGQTVSIAALIALLVCLIPTTIGALLSAIGVAGMSRMMKANVIARSGRAVEAAGDVDVLLLDKTGTITFGNRHAHAFYPASHIHELALLQAAYLASRSDNTPEGKSIVSLIQTLLPQEKLSELDTLAVQGISVEFTAQTRMSGLDLAVHGDVRAIRKGSVDAIERYIADSGSSIHKDTLNIAAECARKGSTPLLVADKLRVMGVIELKDIVKTGIRERFDSLRKMGIKTVMVTGDNRLTAATIAAEAGVDDFLAEATPEDKLKLIRRYQSEGMLVAMTGDGTNDAPALAQADVAVAMNSGTQAAKEAANMVDLDSNPTKLLEVVETGKALLMTRGALTTFSIANDVAKFFAIVPAMFVTTYPVLERMNIMRLASPNSAIVSAVIFNALVIVGLIPLALKGVQYTPIGASALLRKNVLVYGLGGLIVPFIGIKAIDYLISSFHLL